jgi:hypothetical protein
MSYEGPCAGAATIGIRLIDGNEILKTGYRFNVVKVGSGSISLPKSGVAVVPTKNNKEFYFLWSPDTKNGALDITISIKAVSANGQESEEYILHVRNNQQES